MGRRGARLLRGSRGQPQPLRVRHAPRLRRLLRGGRRAPPRQRPSVEEGRAGRRAGGTDDGGVHPRLRRRGGAGLPGREPPPLLLPLGGRRGRGGHRRPGRLRLRRGLPGREPADPARGLPRGGVGLRLRRRVRPGLPRVHPPRLPGRRGQRLRRAPDRPPAHLRRLRRRDGARRDRRLGGDGAVPGGRGAMAPGAGPPLPLRERGLPRRRGHLPRLQPGPVRGGDGDAGLRVPEPPRARRGGDPRGRADPGDGGRPRPRTGGGAGGGRRRRARELEAATRGRT